MIKVLRKAGLKRTLLHQISMASTPTHSSNMASGNLAPSLISSVTSFIRNAFRQSFEGPRIPLFFRQKQKA